MATFYIDSPSEGILELTATTDIQVDERSTPTKFRLETGETITDNVVNENITVTFSGVITNIARLTQPSNQNDSKVAEVFTDPVQGYITALRRIKARKELFKVRYDSRFPAADNCVITNVSLVRNAETGLGYNIALSFEQVRISGRAKTSEIRQIQRSADDTQSETNSGANNQERANRVVITSGGQIGLQAAGFDEGATVVYTSGERDTSVSQDINIVPNTEDE
jgi:hypothetical protein